MPLAQVLQQVLDRQKALAAAQAAEPSGDSMQQQGGDGGMQELCDAEQALERELRQMGSLSGNTAGTSASAAAASSTCAASPTSAAAAEVLSALLEDPGSSVQDIVAVLDEVLAHSRRADSTTLAQQAQQAQAQQQYQARVEGLSDELLAALGFASSDSDCGEDGSTTPAGAPPLPAAAQPAAAAASLPPGARQTHWSPGTAAVATPAPAAAAASRNLAAWQAEGGLMFRQQGGSSSSRPATAGPHHGSSNSSSRAAASARPTSPGYTALQQRRDACAQRPTAAAATTSCDLLQPQRPHSAAAAAAPAGPQEWLWGSSGEQGSPSRLADSRRHVSGRAAAALERSPKFTPEWDRKLQQLYARNVDWRQRCEAVYARQRSAAAASEVQGCTFAPAINRRSLQIAQVWPLGGQPGARCSNSCSLAECRP